MEIDVWDSGTSDTELNVNDPPTVETVIAFLQRFPGQFVTIYEGEGGNWIIIKTRDEP